MKNVLLLCLLSFSLMASAQSKPGIADLHLGYQIIRNDLNGKRVFLSALTLTNKSRKALPAQGWSLFFSFPRLIHATSVSPKMQVQHINGDFYRMTPSASFKGLRPGDTLRIEFVAGAWGTSITDAPAGVYLVWDDQPSKGLSFTNYRLEPATRPEQYLRYTGDKYEPATPARVFADNESIRDIPPAELPKVFPTPAYYKEYTGQVVFDGSWLNGIWIGNKPWMKEADLKTEVELFGADMKLLLQSTRDSAPGKILLMLDTGFTNEGYLLRVNDRGIYIEASTRNGIFYALQSLKTLIPPEAWKQKQKQVLLPKVEIIDQPRFGHRAFLLDVARNFQKKEQVLKLLDLMALYKLNVFHFHFNDDEGWRIEIPGLPELTSVAAKRGHATDDRIHLHPSFGSGPDTTTSGTGYYTRQDFIDILRYARQRHIRVIPEIETPGHARAAIAAMDARYHRLMAEGRKEAAEEYLLYDLNDTSKYRSVQRWFRNVINPALPSTYRFLEKVVDELRLMYAEAGAPLETIHFGGDEVPAGVWTGSPAAHRLIESDTLVNNTNDLWYHFFGKLTQMMKSKGLYVYGWEEAGMRKTRLDGRQVYIPNPDFANTGMQLDVWNNVIGWGAEDLPYQLANAGYKVVLSPVSNMYFDLAYQKDFNEPGQYWGGFLDTEKPFKFIPFDYYRNADIDINGQKVTRSYFNNKERLTDYGKEKIPGVQGLLWAETLSSPEKMEYLLLPKLLGLAERAWSPDPVWAVEKDSARAAELYRYGWSVFVNVAGKRELPRLDHYAGGFQYRIPTPGAIVRDGRVVANMQFPGLVLRYTTDGSEPTVKSPIYQGPISHKGKVRLRLFNNEGRAGRSVLVSSEE
jgi:hexosaminidase